MKLVLLSTSTVLTLPIILCCIRTSFANKHAAFRFSHDVSIRLTILSRDTRNPIVLLDIRSAAKPKIHAPLFLSYFDMMDTSHPSRAHIFKGMPYSIRAPLRTV